MGSNLVTVKAIVEDSLQTQFARQGLEVPGFNRFDVVPTPSGVAVTVDLASDQPVGEIRDIREAVGQALAQRGFRLEPATAPASSPSVRLIITSSHPTMDYLATYEPARLRDYLVVVGLGVGSLLMLVTAYLMFRQLLRVRRRGTAIIVPAPVVQPLVVQTPVTMAPMAPVDEGPAVELPPLESSWPQPASVDTFLQAEIEADAALATSATPDVMALAQASKATVRQTFSQLSLDAALEMLAAVDPATSKAIIDKLQLHRSVRERLEEGLALIRADRQS